MHDDPELTRKDIIMTVARIIGAIAKPDKIQLLPACQNALRQDHAPDTKKDRRRRYQQFRRYLYFA